MLAFYKFRLLLGILLVGLNSAISQAQWVDVSSNRSDVQFSGDIGFMVGTGGTILKTTDKGVNWVNLPNTFSEKDHIEYLRVSDDGQKIKALGNRGWPNYTAILASSNDGGNTWIQNLAITQINARCYFRNDATGWIMDQQQQPTGSEKKTWKTTDEGATWNEDLTLKYAFDISFFNSTQGWALNISPDSTYLTKSNDGGNTWQHFKRINQERIGYLSRLVVVDQTTAWITPNINEYAYPFYKTTDGGLNWQNVPYNAQYGVTFMSFLDAQTGWIIADNQMELMKTTDGGSTWQKKFSSSDFYLQRLKKVVFANANDGYLIGMCGFLAVTHDGGETWHIENYSTAGSDQGILDIYLDGERSWILANYLLLHSDGSYKVWEKSILPNATNISDVDFAGAFGTMVGNGFTVTEDSGTSWQRATPTRQSAPNYYPDDMRVYTRSGDVIWYSGINGNIYKSTDGGQSLKISKSFPSGLPPDQFALAFTQNDDVVYAYGFPSQEKAYVSFNAGTTWKNLNEYIRSVHFLNETIGWKITWEYPSPVNNVYKTIDGGQTWKLMGPLDPAIGMNEPKLRFIDENNGWISMYHNKLYTTNNGGKTWTVDPTGVKYNIRAIEINKYPDGHISGLAGGSKLLKYVGNKIADPVITLNKPDNLTIIDTTETSLSLAWTDEADNEDGYLVQRRNADGSYQTLDSLGPNTTAYAHIVSTGGQNFTYRAAAFIRGRAVALSEPLEVSIPLVLIPPVNLVTSAISENGMTVSWQYGASNHQEFILERAMEAGAFSPIATLSKTTLSYNDGSLQHETLYNYRVKAKNGAVESVYSDVISSSTLAPSPPASPTNLVINVTSDSTLLLTWTDHAGNEEGFFVDRSSNGVDFETIATLGPNSNQYLDEVEINVMYTYRVRAFRFSVSSDFTSADGIIEVITAAEETIRGVINVYPNPVDDYMLIANAGAETIKKVGITNFLGEQVMTTDTGSAPRDQPIVIRCAHLAPGMYLLSVETAKGRSILKIIKR